MTELTFTVPGIPQPQGSKTVYNGRAVEANKKLKPWRTRVTAAALGARRPHDPIVGPVVVALSFTFPRPAYHYGTGRNASVIKSQHVAAMHTSKPDVDKLTRGCLDAMSGVVFRDDSQVVSVTAAKSYGEPGVTVTVTEIQERP